MPQETNSATLAIQAESSWGADFPGSPTGTGEQINMTGESLGLNKDLTQSESIRSDRVRTSASETGFNVEGEINFEWQHFVTTEALGLLVAAALTADWAAADSEGSTGSSTTDFTGLTTNLIKKGQVFKCDTGANAGIHQAKAVTTTTITATKALTAGSDVTTLDGTRIQNGTIKKSFLAEKYFPDAAAASRYMQLNGLRVGGLSLDLTAQAIAQGSFRSMMGKTVQASNQSAFTSSNPMVTADSLNGSNNVADIFVDGTALDSTNGGAVRRITFDLANNPRAVNRVGASAPQGVSLGFMDITGELETFWEDKALLDKLLSHTAVSIMFALQDDVSQQAVGFYLPKVFLSGGAAPIPGGNQDVMQRLRFTAVQDDTEGCVVRISVAG